MTDLTKFQQYLQLADRLVEIANKEQLEAPRGPLPYTYASIEKTLGI